MKEFLFLFFGFLMLELSAQVKQVDPNIYVRRGYKLDIVLDDQKAARFMEFDDKGRLFLSIPTKGLIKSCTDADGDGYYETVVTYVEGHPRLQAMF